MIDEVQRAPDLLLAIKSRLDRDRSPGQFLLTGSANLRHVPGVTDALPGRLDYLTLWPLTQGEIAGRHEDVLQRVFDGHVPSVVDAPVGRHEYAEMLVPEGSPRPACARRRRDAVLHQLRRLDRGPDVVDVARVQDPTAGGTLLELVAARSGALGSGARTLKQSCRRTVRTRAKSSI